MIILLSSSKSMQLNDIQADQMPFFLNEAYQLNQKLKGLSKRDVLEFFKSSESLTEKIYEDIKKWNKGFHEKKSQAALYSFNGDAFGKLSPKSLSDKGKSNAQQCIRILSGQYGILKAMDSIQPYRLDMAQKVEGEVLTNYWKKKITERINIQNKNGIIINLASKEYSSAIDRNALLGRWIDIDFYERRKNNLKMVSIFSKQARGLAARYICDKIEGEEDIENLKRFTTAGYTYDNSLSGDNKWVFVR